MEQHKVARFGRLGFSILFLFNCLIWDCFESVIINSSFSTDNTYILTGHRYNAGELSFDAAATGITVYRNNGHDCNHLYVLPSSTGVFLDDAICEHAAYIDELFLCAKSCPGFDWGN